MAGECVTELQKYLAAQMPSANEMLRKHEFGTGAGWLAGARQRLAEERLMNLSTWKWEAELARLLARLDRPVTDDGERVGRARERQAVTKALAEDQTQPKEVRQQAAVASIEAGASVSRAEFQQMGLELAGLKEETRAQAAEIVKLGKMVRRLAREEAEANGNLECKRFLELLRSGAEACEEVELLGARNRPLYGGALGAFVNGAREGGRSVAPLFKQPDGEEYETDTLCKYFNKCHGHPNPPPRGRPRGADWKQPELFRYVEKWWLAGNAKEENAATNTENVPQLHKVA